MAGLRELLRGGEAGRTRADDGDRCAGTGDLGHRDPGRPALEVGAVLLELADLHRRRLALEADDARALAELLLRADPAADLRQVRGLAEDTGRADGVGVLDPPERCRDVVPERAGLRHGAAGH